METPKLKKKKETHKYFYAFLSWFFICINTHLYRKSVMEALIWNSNISKWDVRGHVTCSHQVKMLRYVWTVEEVECFCLLMETVAAAVVTTEILQSGVSWEEIPLG